MAGGETRWGGSRCGAAAARTACQSSALELVQPPRLTWAGSIPAWAKPSSCSAHTTFATVCPSLSGEAIWLALGYSSRVLRLQDRFPVQRRTRSPLRSSNSPATALRYCGRAPAFGMRPPPMPATTSSGRVTSFVQETHPVPVCGFRDTAPTSSWIRTVDC